MVSKMPEEVAPTCMDKFSPGWVCRMRMGFPVAGLSTMGARLPGKPPVLYCSLLKPVESNTQFGIPIRYKPAADARSVGRAPSFVVQRWFRVKDRQWTQTLNYLRV